MKDTYLKEIKYEPCKQEEINFNGDADEDAYTFYTPAVEFETDVKRFAPDLNCLRGDTALQGDYDASRGKQLLVAFEICTDPEGTSDAEKKCFPEKEIYKWMRRKFILVLENQILFKS